MTEIELQKQICNYLNLNGHFVWRQNTGLAFYVNAKGKKRAFRASFKGCSDIVGLLKLGKIGVIICIETKIKKNKLSDYQVKFLREIREKGGIAFVARSLNNVIKVVSELQKYDKNLSILSKKIQNIASATEILQ